MKKIVAFVPLKLNSRRLPNKNFLRLGGVPMAYHIFDSLSKVDLLESIYCYTSQPQVLELLPDDIELLMRPPYLDGDEVKGNELFQYAVENLDAEIIVLCHATAPFLASASIEAGIDAVMNKGFDCSFSVQRQQVYSWYKGAPINYIPKNMAQTQGLDPIFCETSGFYIFKKEDYLNSGTRIGKKPFMVEVDFRESIDIDNPEDFSLASHMLSYDTDEKDVTRDQFFVNMANVKSPHKNISHVSFDLDGVLIDSLPLMEASWEFCMNKLGLNFSFEQYKNGVGMPFFKILESMGIPEAHHADIFTYYNEYSMSHLEVIQVAENARAALSRLRDHGVNISVVTSKNKERTELIIDQLLGRDLFDLVVSPEDVPSGRGKPHPDPILLACTTLGSDPYNTIYVGDMIFDKEAASRAGTHFVYANWGYGELKKIKDVWFNNLKDLVDYIIE